MASADIQITEWERMWENGHIQKYCLSKSRQWVLSLLLYKMYFLFMNAFRLLHSWDVSYSFCLCVAVEAWSNAG